MNVTEKEINKFISLFYPEDCDLVCDILSSKKVFLICTYIKENNSGNFIRTEETRDADLSGHYSISYPMIKEIRLNSWINKNDIDFILSFISRYFKNFKLILSSSLLHIFVATTENIQVILREDSFVELDDKVVKFLVADLFSHGDCFAGIRLSEYNGDLSDELWNIILNYGDNSARILSAYTSGKYAFSEKIGKRINDLYESLSDSDKLLLELGEKI